RSEHLAPLGVPQVPLDTLCESADVVTLHTPLDASTRDLFDASRLARLRPGAILVNTARGAIVDEGALLAALDAGHLAGAFLDVLREEPAAPSPLTLHPRVLTSAHVGGSTDASVRAMAAAALRNLEEAMPVPLLRARLSAGVIEPLP
ncbi:MAG TPA: NAD(P)-dependent oxidoreductase, partial [Sandaracinaceae bacterium]